ncbi:hypothetical protein GWK47_045530 [Chionoecetes opilio]|uniref:Peptidase C14 caspase domain-containing protein n=1 Tax=Chionoecetes opilio TaxID=41210 RepID=A0A8J4Y785_CHIOP|nr:hypothetical protein GWK47_045530 [Chionoecetes opilio]
MTPLSCSMKIVESVADNAIPTMAFLLLDPKKMQNEGTGINYHDKLRDAFQLAVKDKTMDNLRTCLQQCIVTILEKCQEKLNTKKSVSLMRNFTGKDSKLYIYDEAILRLKEVLPQFSCQVPKDIKDAFKKICKEKEIPAEDDYGKDKEFFVLSEIKTLRKICDALSEEDVCQMYDNLRKRTGNYFHEKASCKTLLQLNVSFSDLKNIKGMKETSFYCFVMGLYKEGLLNRVHTNHLYDYMKNKHEMDAASDFKVDLNLYSLTSKPPGICIIFNVEKNRQGSDCDLKKVEELFRETFMYDVVPVKNPTRQDVRMIIEELKADRNKFYDRGEFKALRRSFTDWWRPGRRVLGGERTQIPLFIMNLSPPLSIRVHVESARGTHEDWGEGNERPTKQ